MKHPTLYPIQKDAKYGYIDQRGICIVSPQYEFATEFNGGVGAAFLDMQLRIVEPSGSAYLIATSVEPCWIGFRENAIAVESGGLSGILDTGGNWIVPPQFTTVHPYDGSTALVENVDGLYGVVDKGGRWLLNPEFTYLTGFSKGCSVCLGRRRPDEDGVYLISSDGTPISANVYAGGYRGRGARIPVCKRTPNGLRYGLVDETGVEVTGFRYTSIEDVGSEKYWGVSLDGQTWGVISNNGDWVIKPSLSWIGRFSEGLFVAASGGTWIGGQLEDAKLGFVNENGDWVIQPCFEDAWEFCEGIAKVVLNPMTPFVKTGYIDLQGEYIWEPSC